MTTRTMNNANHAWMTPHERRHAACTSFAGTGSLYRVVLKAPSPKKTADGCTLADLIKRQGRFDDHRALRVSIAILKKIFEKMYEGGGVFPKNLTPSGIVFGQNGEIDLLETDPQITLVAKADSEGARPTISGTPAYMSPENATGLSEGSRVGIYTFGTILYEMLAGQPPYSETSPQKTLDAVKRAPPKRLIQLNPAADHRLISICETCMNRRISSRYPSLFDLYSDLERLQAANHSRSASRIRGWLCSMLSAFI